jgi:hypothetical protein
MARALKVHPAAILVAALIAANLLGILGVIIAAPFLATITLLGRYTMRKLFDMEPWSGPEIEPPLFITSEWIGQIRQFIQSKFRKGDQKKKINSKE